MTYFFKQTSKISYGTAGFRMKAEKLEPIMFFVGVLASLRSFQKKQIVGVMITASHNEVHDNGVKIVEPNGDCLDMKWEKYAERLVNESHTQDDFHRVVDEIKKEQNITECNGMIYIGYDTRPSREILFSNLLDGIKAMKCEHFSFGLLTTPQVHFMVRHDNDGNTRSQDESPYYKTLAENLHVDVSKRLIDCSYGVASPVLRKLSKYLKYDLSLVNDDVSQTQLLNSGCGAEFVQKEQKQPKINGKIIQETVAHFDGDADRIVYSFCKDGKFTIIDGDKIASLLALYFAKFKKDLSIGSVQTAYANGASTKYLKSLLDHVDIEPTGVKYLHHRAQHYDIGIYFESNGHGTVVFSIKAIGFLSKNHPEAYQVVKLINQTVGDAISDLCVIETILDSLKMSIQEWHGLYKDLPNLQMKVKVNDKNSIKPCYNETEVVEPFGMQQELNDLMNKYPGSRTFVRPSGTEDVIRIYLEGQQEDLEPMTTQVVNIIKKFDK